MLGSRRNLLLILTVICSLGASYAWWQGRWSSGQTLPGRLVDYHEIYDVFWDVACDTAMDGSDRGCYVQYVDVYRPQPDFAASMVEVVFHAGEDGRPDPHVRFDIEPGLIFSEATMAVQTETGLIPIDVSECPTNTCRFSGDAGRAVLLAWRSGTELLLEIEEGRGAKEQRVWPLGNINAILDNLAVQRQVRGLP